MARIAPPQPPARVILDDDDGHQRTQFLFRQLWLTVLTVVITAWLVTLGTVPAVIALVTAKHVLVAILVMGLGVDTPREADL